MMAERGEIGWMADAVELTDDGNTE